MPETKTKSSKIATFERIFPSPMTRFLAFGILSPAESMRLNLYINIERTEVLGRISAESYWFLVTVFGIY